MLARCDLQALKQCFENLAVQEILNKKEQMPSVIGGVFVKKALAGICLQVCKDYTDPTGERDNTKVSSKYSDVIKTLLRSSEYEVRSVVLEFVLSQLPSVLNNSLECEIALDKNSSTTSSWTLIGLQSAQFKTQLFTMAIKAEQHVDCLVKVTVNFRFAFVLAGVGSTSAPQVATTLPSIYSEHRSTVLILIKVGFCLLSFIVFWVGRREMVGYDLDDNLIHMLFQPHRHFCQF